MSNFDLEPDEDRDKMKPTMTARYSPRGLPGILYWYAVLPLLDIVFGGLPKGTRSTAEATQRADEAGACAELPENRSTRGYGRARLWLGITAVGSIVTLCTLGLIFDVAGMVQQRVDSGILESFLALLLFVLVYAAIQLPFDLFGGYLLPRRFGRSHPALASYLVQLARGVAAHSALLLLATIAVMYAGAYGGIAGTVAAGLAMTLILLGGRVAIASLMARLELTPGEPTSAPTEDRIPVRMAHSPDEGFTGGVLGVLRPRSLVLPSKWKEVLGPGGFAVAIDRRSLAVKTGSWKRGRVMALLFTILGFVLAAWLTGPSRLGTAGGTIAFSLSFSLWTFVGLLILPSLSRRGVIEVDERTRAEGCPSEAIRTNTHILDDLQDGEPDRPSFVETVFHPIPSASKRLEGLPATGAIGFWDVARTSVYISLAGLGLLGRAVHCNCGRPSLWVMLPTD